MLIRDSRPHRKKKKEEEEGGQASGYPWRKGAGMGLS